LTTVSASWPFGGTGPRIVEELVKTPHTDDLVKVAVEISAWGEVLQTAGIRYRVVGDDPSVGQASALLDAVELWVHHTDAEAAEVELAARFHNCLDDTSG
jgi:hypothetical protein